MPIPKLRSVLVLSTCFLLVTSAFAKDEATPNCFKIQMDRDLDELRLSSEQASRVDVIRKTYKDQIPPLRTKLRELRKNLRVAITDESSNDELMKIFQTIQSDQDRLQRLVFDRVLKIREVLTLEQRKMMGGLLKDPGERGRAEPCPGVSE